QRRALALLLLAHARDALAARPVVFTQRFEQRRRRVRPLQGELMIDHHAKAAIEAGRGARALGPHAQRALEAKARLPEERLQLGVARTFAVRAGGCARELLEPLLG